MRYNGIRGIIPRPWEPVTSISDQGPHRIPDLVERRFDQGRLNLVWTTDITYLSTGQEWLYLAAVRDGCSRRVLGYAFSDSLPLSRTDGGVLGQRSAGKFLVDLESRVLPTASVPD